MPIPRLTESTALRCGLVSTMVLALATAGAAEPSRHARRSQPVPLSRAAPDTTGTIATGTLGTLKRPLVATDDETLPPPFNLPVAPRARVRTCGEKWQAIKLGGQAGDETWREYATKCLASNQSTMPALPGPRDVKTVDTEGGGKTSSP